MHVAPVVNGGVAVRAVSLLAGLALFAFSIVLMLEADLGLSPWDVLNQGIGERTPLSFGLANVAVAIFVLALAWRLGARIGVGTVANAALIGLLVDAFAAIDVIEGWSDGSLGVRVALLVSGLVLVGIASGLYIGAAMGAGPRDSLMLIAARRTGLRIGLVRSGLEIVATALGFALGGTLGVGTLAFALSIGWSVELGFWLLLVTGLARPGASRIEAR
jgi:uncharacterized membrane protein YczE